MDTVGSIFAHTHIYEIYQIYTHTQIYEIYQIYQIYTHTQIYEIYEIYQIYTHTHTDPVICLCPPVSGAAGQAVGG